VRMILIRSPRKSATFRQYRQVLAGEKFNAFVGGWAQANHSRNNRSQQRAAVATWIQNQSFAPLYQDFTTISAMASTLVCSVRTLIAPRTVGRKQVPPHKVCLESCVNCPMKSQPFYLSLDAVLSLVGAFKSQ